LEHVIHDAVYGSVIVRRRAQSFDETPYELDVIPEMGGPFELPLFSVPVNRGSHVAEEFWLKRRDRDDGSVACVEERPSTFASDLRADFAQPKVSTILKSWAGKFLII
jgi:hypothetical protein